MDQEPTHEHQLKEYSDNINGLCSNDFVTAVYSDDPEITALNILQQIKHISNCLKAAWKKYIILVGNEKHQVFSRLYERYLLEQSKGTNSFFIKSIVSKPTIEGIIDWTNNNVIETHKKIIDKIRPNLKSQSFKEITVNLY